MQLSKMNVIKVTCVGNYNAKKTQLLSVLSGDKYKYDKFASIHNKMKNYFTCNVAITADSHLEIRIFNTEDTVSILSNTMIYIIKGKLVLLQ